MSDEKILSKFQQFVSALYGKGCQAGNDVVI
jgi:hypothetical protein